MEDIEAFENFKTNKAPYMIQTFVRSKPSQYITEHKKQSKNAELIQTFESIAIIIHKLM